MKKYFYALCMATALGTVGCSDDEAINSGDVIDPSLKTSISFSASDEAGGGTSTKALTKADDAGFTAETQIAARFVSKEGSTTNVRFTRTLLLAKPAETGQPYSYSKVDFSGELYKRYWDDAFGRAAKISVYAIAVPGKSNVENGETILEKKLDDTGTAVNATSNPNWKTAGTENNTMSWTVSHTDQTDVKIGEEDLCYSNNIQADGKYGRYVWNKTDGKYPDFKYEANPTNPYPNFSDGELSFQLDDNSKREGPGHFDKGHMIFKHALTRVTINLYAGEGFDMTKSPQPFGFTNAHVPKNVTLHNMPTSGTLDIKKGEWSGQDYSKNIEGVYEKADKRTTLDNTSKSNTPAYTLKAQMLPGYIIKADDVSDNVMSFEIDNNVYYVSHKQINDALRAGGLTGSGDITMQQGTHYVLNITVKKTAISNVTATLVNWKEVTSDRFNADNAYITLNSFIPTDNKLPCGHFDLYRVLRESKSVSSPDKPEFDGSLLPPMSGYADIEGVHTAHMLSTENSGEITKNSDGSWKTTWFFENNKTFYFFRTVWPGTTITADESLSSGDFFTMYSGPVNTNESAEISSRIDDGKYNDYHWGAVFKGDISNLKYDPENGFESQLTGPIGPTKSSINIVEQHMMSKIKVVLLTPVKDDGTYMPQSVTLYDDAKERKVSEVNLIKFSGSANVLMGTGKIIPSVAKQSKSEVSKPEYNREYTAGATDNYCETKDHTFGEETQKYYKTKAYTYCVVPQPLVSGTDKVGITIQTPDDNLYYVVEDLSKITVRKVEGSSVKQDHIENNKIVRWYPGYSYTYYFVLKKTGIEAITCTIVDWKNVEGKKQDVTLQD